MKSKFMILIGVLVALAFPASALAAGETAYNTGDTSSAADQDQALTLEVDPAIEVLAIGPDDDTVSPQAGGDGGADDAEFTASVDLRSNLTWASTATETNSFSLVAGSVTSSDDENGDGSNGAENKGDNVQEYDVNFAIDVSWADDASPEATPYDATIDHDVSNTL